MLSSVLILCTLYVSTLFLMDLMSCVFILCTVDMDPKERVLLGSCGMYVFRTDVLKRLLSVVTSQDIGKDLIPAAVKAGLRVRACVVL